MSCEELFRQTLKNHGLRMTNQRELILKALHVAKGPVGVEEIYDEARKHCSVLNLSTVYRTLDLFQEFGLVAAIKAHGITLYEHLGLNEPHIHLLCNSCKKIFSVPMKEAEFLLTILEEQYQFQVNLTEITFRGLCRDCQAKT